MKIPCAIPISSSYDLALLQKIGFNLTKDKVNSSYYYLELPEEVHCQENYIDFTRRTLTLYLKDVPIIDICQKISVQKDARYVRCYIDEHNLACALSREEVEQDPWVPPFENRVKRELDRLKYCIENAERGYAISIHLFLSDLKKDMDHQPECCQKIIASNLDYQKLFTLFPNWLDQYGIQSYCQKHDVGPFLAMLSPKLNELSLDALIAKFGLQQRINPPILSLSVLLGDSHADPVIMQLKKLTYEYAEELTLANHLDAKGESVRDEKLTALKRVHKELDNARSAKEDKSKIETTLQQVKETLKKDNDYKAIRFLKQCSRLLEAVFTFSFNSHKKESLKLYGTAKFWKPPEELRGKLFIKVVKKAVGIKKPF